jgi:formylglycine-generating enzyme
MGYLKDLINVIVNIKTPLMFWSFISVVILIALHTVLKNPKLLSDVLHISGEKLGRNQFYRLLKLVIISLFILALIALISTFAAPIIGDSIRLNYQATTLISDAMVNNPKLIPVKSELVNYIVLSSTVLHHGDTLSIKINTHSSKIRTFGIFEGQVKVEGKYNPKKGGIYINYQIPLDANLGRHKARIFIQEIGGMKEDKPLIEYDIVEAKDGKNNQTDKLSQDELGFIYINDGNLQMGADNGNTDERPVHNVKISSFWIMDHELTIGQLKKISRLYPDLGIKEIEDVDYLDNLLSIEAVDLNSLPAILSWSDARRVAAKLNKFLNKLVRLPTEAEWEYAARGGSVGKEYPWGNKNDRVDGQVIEDLVSDIIGGAEHCRYSRIPVHPVKTLYPPNQYKLFDMAGNVWEWTSSVYRPYPYLANDGRERENDSEFRVIRGGGNAPETCDVRVSFRGYGQVESTFGVRFAMNN